MQLSRYLKSIFISLREVKEPVSLQPLLWSLRVITIMVLALFLVQYVHVAVERIAYPFELEWNEGDIAVAAIRVAQGKPLYPDPEQGYVPYFYPPLYQILCGLLFKIFGASLTIGRAVSFIASLGMILVLALTIWNWTRDYYAATVAGLFYIACYRVSGYWTDLMRVDSFAWLLSFTTICLLLNKNKPSAFRLIVAGILVVATAFAKQNAIIPIIPAALFLLIHHHRRSGIFFVIAAVLIVNLVWIYVNYKNPWFLKYYYQIPSRHVVFWKLLKERLPQQLYPYITLPAIFAGCWLVISALFPKRQSPLTLLWFLLILIASIVAGLSGYLKIGGFVNNFFPIIAAMSLIIGLGFHFFWQLFTGNQHSKIVYILFWAILIGAVSYGVFGSHKAEAQDSNLPLLIVAFLIIIGLAIYFFVYMLPRQQLFMPALIVHIALLIFMVYTVKPLLYNHKDILPYPGSKERGHELIEKIRNLPGKVYIPHHNYYAYLAGKDIFYSVDAVRDLNWAGIGTPKALRDALSRAVFDWIILDIDLAYEWIPADLTPHIRQNYVPRGNVINYRHFLELEPRTGCTMKPRFLWQSRKATQPAGGF